MFLLSWSAYWETIWWLGWSVFPEATKPWKRWLLRAEPVEICLPRMGRIFCFVFRQCLFYLKYVLMLFFMSEMVYVFILNIFSSDWLFQTCSTSCVSVSFNYRKWQGTYGHGKAWKKSCHGKSWKSHGKCGIKKVMEILEKSWNFSTACREWLTRSSDNCISIGLLQWFGYERVSVYVLNSKSSC